MPLFFKCQSVKLNNKTSLQKTRILLLSTQTHTHCSVGGVQLFMVRRVYWCQHLYHHHNQHNSRNSFFINYTYIKLCSIFFIYVYNPRHTWAITILQYKTEYIRCIGLPVTNAAPEIFEHLTSILSLPKHLYISKSSLVYVVIQLNIPKTWL